MTALEKFTRLESTGLWRAERDAQRIEVIVKFGDASLVLSDTNGRPYTHWSLAAITRLERHQNTTVYTVDAQGEETLELDDQVMIEAIDKVRNAVRKSRPSPGRLRLTIAAGIVLAISLLCFFWLPNAAARYAVSLVPDARVDQFGREALDHVSEFTGPVCQAPEVQIILDKLERRIIGTDSNQLSIVDLGTRRSALLPGGQILLNRSLVSAFTGPEVLAGYALLERASQDETQPLLELFQFAGLRETMRFLSSGNLSPGVLASFSKTRLTGSLSSPDTENLRLLFEVAELSSEEFTKVEPAYASLQENDPFLREFRPLLSDAEWLALQNVCS